MTHRIGAFVPLTAPGWIEAGEHLLAGLRLGCTDVNRAGGIHRVPLELLVRDSAANPSRASAGVDELAASGVVALAGEYHSVVARAIAERADALGLPFLCSSAVLEPLTEQTTRWVARIAPAQSRSWQLYADFLLDAGHRRIAVMAQPGVYWTTGARRLSDRFAEHGGTVIVLDAATLPLVDVGDELTTHRVTALLLLVAYPEPAISIVRSVRRDGRFPHMLIGAPAGQPEFSGWEELERAEGASIPFLRYLPERLSPRGQHVQTALRDILGMPPSFVALEGYDTILVLSEMLRIQPTRLGPRSIPWPDVTVQGTRGHIHFSRAPGASVWQWEEAPIEIVDRDPANPKNFRILLRS